MAQRKLLNGEVVEAIAMVDSSGNIVNGGGGGGGGGSDRELVVSIYSAVSAFSGASVGDVITCTQVIDVTSSPVTVGVVWRNQTTGSDLGGPPAANTIALVGAGALTDAQLRASALAVAPNVSRAAGTSDANTQRVVLASDSPAVASLANIDADLGTTNAAAATSDTGDFSLIALAKRALQNWTTLLGRVPAPGIAAPSASIPVVQSSDVTVTGPAAQSAINTDLLTGTVNGWYDAGAFQSGSIQILASAGISAGAVIFEQTNDTTAAPAGVALRAYEASSISANPNVAAITIAASTVRLFVVPINARFVRVRISTAFVGGTVQAVATFSQRAASFPVINVQQATAANMQVTATQAVGSAATRWFAQISDGTNSPAVKAASVPAASADTSLVVAVSPNSLVPLQFTDVASAALTTTTTTAAITPIGGTSYEVNIPVTAVTGTTPTLDVGIEESDDGGTNWFRVYDFPRITANGMYRSPKLPITGNRVRYVQTVGGTTPSFTRAVNRLQSYDSVPVPIRQLIDRSVVLTTLSSVTPSLTTQGCRNVQLVVNIGAVTTTAPALQLEGSDDNGATWYAIGTALTAVASSTVQVTVANVQAGLLRARVSTAGVGVTAGYVLIKGF